MIQLIKLQQKPCREIVEYVIEWAELGRMGQNILLHGFPGTGKTVIITRAIAEISHQYATNLPGRSVCFIYLSSGILPSQTCRKMIEYDQGSGMVHPIKIDGIRDNIIGDRQTLLMPWQKIDKSNNVFATKNEKGLYLSNVISNTKDAGTDIVLFVDESHYVASTVKSIDIQNNDINPNVTIDISATPNKKKNYNKIVTVDTFAAIEAGMIRRSILANPGIEDFQLQLGRAITEFDIVDIGLRTRNHLHDIYKSIDSTVNPLLIIQLSYDYAENSESSLKKMLVHLALRDIFEDEIGIHLDKMKKNLDDVYKNDCKIKIVICKNALVNGWDCPRAQVLAVLREKTDNITFNTQGVGRTVRTPEHKHYNIPGYPELDSSHVFHYSKYLSIATDIPKDMVIDKISYRKDEVCNDINLPCSLSPRNKKSLELKVEKFESIFKKIVKEKLKEEEILLQPGDVMYSIGSDGSGSFDVEEDGKIVITGKICETEIQGIDIERSFDNGFIKHLTKPFNSTGDSMNKMKNIFRRLFHSEFDFPWLGSLLKIQRIILSNDSNIRFFKNATARAVEVYKEDYEREERTVKHSFWNPPEKVGFCYDTDTSKIVSDKFIRKPGYVLRMSDSEKDFVETISDNPDVLWFDKNGTKSRDARNLSIVYYKKDGSLTHLWPDWVVAWINGVKGIYDTKGGKYARTEDAGPRARCLYDYRQKYGEKILLDTGIVVYHNENCYINRCENYVYNEDTLLKDGWELFDMPPLNGSIVGSQNEFVATYT